mmetsp:Transcript_19317/g.55208  ORF Transcript_19317/g.55208 Transcript_19317/m.55208 type:complete len:216 (+) Transcript_19317:680-1327(+)
MHRSTNWSMSRPRSASTLSRWTSRTGFFLAAASGSVSFRSRIGVPKVSASMSSVAAANALPERQSSAHCASASPGAMTTGMPMRLSSLMTSSLCSLVTRVERLLALSIAAMASLSPSSSFCSASLASSSALVLVALRFFNSSSLSSGGLPSKTKTGRRPSDMRLIVRWKKPCRWLVTSPASLVSCCAGPPAAEERICTIMAYSCMDASMAMVCPR